jgi:hypothetical protein
VFFSTVEALVPEDVNGRSDAYEWENGEVHLLTDGVTGSDSYFLDASPDGSDVFVVTRARLSGWDSDGSYDLYDVRQPVSPGHPAGVLDPPPVAAACVPGGGVGGPACREPLVQPPPLVSPPATIAFSGAGNLEQKAQKARPKPARCRGGAVRKRRRHGGRCVRQPKKRRRGGKGGAK